MIPSPSVEDWVPLWQSTLDCQCVYLSNVTAFLFWHGSGHWTHVHTEHCWQVSPRRCLREWRMLESLILLDHKCVCITKRHRSMCAHCVLKLQESCAQFVCWQKCVKSVWQHSEHLVAVVTQLMLQLGIACCIKHYHKRWQYLSKSRLSSRKRFSRFVRRSWMNT